MYRRLALLAGGLVLLSAASLFAQDGLLSQMYGRGVHAYFSEDYQGAYEYFTSAIDGGSKDPRCYYYRGLTYLRLGRPEEAEMDFQKGAELEAGDVSKFYNVPRALERIQGRRRMMIEQHRTKARIIAMERAEQLRALRYEQMREEEAQVLREQAEAAPETPAELPTEPAAPETTVIAPAPVEEKPATPPAKPATPPAEPATPPTAPAKEDPFATAPAAAPAEPATPPAAPAAEDPFATEPTTPTAPTPPPADEDPFATKPAPGGDTGGVLGAMGKALGKAITGGGGEPSETAIEFDSGPAGVEVQSEPLTEEEFNKLVEEAKQGQEDPFRTDQPAAPADENPFATPPAAPEKSAAPAEDPFAK